MKYLSFLSICSLLISTSCGRQDNDFDATGTFEADEIIISAEGSGKLMNLDIEEGQTLDLNQYLGYIDTTQLYLSKGQLTAQIEAVLSRKPDVAAQLAALNEQLKAAKVEEARVEKLLQSGAATAKQMDDIKAQVDLVNGNIRALRTSLINSSASLEKETAPLGWQIKQLDDQIERNLIHNPLKGTVLSVYANAKEQVNKGQAIYRIADLEELTLKAYITGDQFALLEMNQEVRVFTDDGDGGYRETTGIVNWISSKAEFTPKAVQTKSERANKVYAIKVGVKNDGTYKIGMYGELILDLEG